MTPFAKVYDAFLEKMEADEAFFDYFNLNEAASLILARERARTYLKESIAVILRRCESDAAFDDYDEELEEFGFDLTPDEIDMLACLMYEQEYRRQLSKTKALRMQHVPTSLQVFSPANERKTILATYQALHEENLTMLDNYCAKDRTTHKSKAIDYAAYADDES